MSGETDMKPLGNCYECGHPSVSHEWEKVYEMGVKVDEISTGCRVLKSRRAKMINPGPCLCAGFIEDVERSQARLI